ncbi:MAG: c-type cytochrome [Acidisphaera sp.]|nr:c-type cytochrome [Acidisphaera sp.]
MRRLFLVLAAALLPIAALPFTAGAAPDDYTQVERGRYLAIGGDCVACHTIPGGTQWAGGRGIQTPFGDIVTPNLTPDEETGIGHWSADDFYRAMHTGVMPSGAHLYPAFPYTYYTKVTRADSDAIYAFLRTLPAVHNAVDRDTLPFPFKVRALMLGWNEMFFRAGTFEADPQRSAEYNRGAYLVEGLGHCGACHTPMNWAGANDAARYLQGNVLQAWTDPNITDEQRIGLGSWSVDDIVEYLKTGRNARAQASGPMAEVVVYSTSGMSDADLHAIATYLKQRGAAGPAAPSPRPADDAQMQSGAVVYTDNCSACHKRDGTGVEAMFPPLRGDQVVQQTDPTTVLRIVLQGAQGAATDAAPTAPAMPAFSWRLSDQQVADVVTYIRNSWGNTAQAVPASDAARLRKRVADTAE